MRISNPLHPLLPLFIMTALVFVFMAEPAHGAKKKAAPLVVVGKATQSAVIDEVPLTGTVISPRLSKLSTEVSGLVKSVQVDIGSRVQQGDALLELDNELGELALRAAQAENEQARQSLADARRRLKDAQRLIKRKTVSENELRSLEAEVKIDTAAMRRTTAEQQRQQVRLNKHRLIAPFDGVISRKYVEQGEWVQPGDAVLELVATDGLYIDFQLPQAAYPKVNHDSAIKIKFETLPGKIFDGQVKAIVPVSDASARTLLLRVTLQDKAAITHGMSASGVLRLSSVDAGVVVPRDAVLRYPDGRVTVWVVEGKGKDVTVKEVPVKTGLSFDGKVSIEAGLKSGDRIVLEGNESLRTGQKVIIHSSR